MAARHGTGRGPMRALRISLLLLGCSLTPRLAQAESTRCTTPQLTTEGVSLRTHQVERGESLSGIALRYGASVQTIALANGLGPDRGIRAGQSLVIPLKTRPGGGDDWMKYTRTPKQRGSLDLVGFKATFRGPVVKNGRVLPAARRAISELLGAKGSRPPVPDRLIRLLVRVSDTFGGRPLRIVSGFRTSSFYADSHHKRSEAVDFSIPGVPNEVLRQYLLLLDDVGVGYYPRSSFVHLDVRPCPTQWVDYSGPYEAPRRSPLPVKLANRARVKELEAVAERVVSAMKESGESARATDSAPHDAERDEPPTDAAPEDVERPELPAVSATKASARTTYARR
jgi:LysM repeat protein